MDSQHQQILIEYLKEQYAQARQHETRQTASTTFLTAASAAIVGIAFHDGNFDGSRWWAGLVVIGLASANLGILEAHQIGNRFHTKLAGKVRRKLESLIDMPVGDTPTFLRQSALSEMGLKVSGISIGNIVYKKLRIIPIVILFVGIFILFASLYSNCVCHIK